jgi:hypothetical protein
MDSRLEFKTSPTSSSATILLFVEVKRGRARVRFMYDKEICRYSNVKQGERRKSEPRILLHTLDATFLFEAATTSNVTPSFTDVIVSAQVSMNSANETF